MTDNLKNIKKTVKPEVKPSGADRVGYTKAAYFLKKDKMAREFLKKHPVPEKFLK